MCHLKHSLSVDFVITLLVVYYYLDKKTCSFTQRNNNNKTLVNPPNVSKSHWDLRGAKSLHPSYKLCQNLDSSWTFCSLANFGIRVFGHAFTSYPLFRWYPQSNESLLNLNMKCSNSAFNAQGSRLPSSCTGRRSVYTMYM
jgi:hypothetical protein